MKNHYYYLFVLIFFSLKVNSQQPVPDNQSTKLNDLLYSEIFTSKIGAPNTAGFRQVNFLNVGEYTGSTSINVPIYQIQI